MNQLQIMFQEKKLHLRWLMILFYFVGIIGFSCNSSRDLFMQLTPFVLMLSFITLLLMNALEWNSKTILIYTSIFLFTFFVEVIGVNTGILFGHYSYNSGLGVKIFNTPVLIGINWLMLSIIFSSLVSYIKLNDMMKIIAGTIGMMIYDLVLEHTAPLLDMWYWKDDQIPVLNYFTWFGLSFLIMTLLVKSGLSRHNPLALTIVLCQLIFFVVVLIFSK